MCDQAVGGVWRDWRGLSTGEQALVITQTALISGSALTADSSQSAVLGLIQDRGLAVPGIEGRTFHFNATGPTVLWILPKMLGSFCHPL